MSESRLRPIFLDTLGLNLQELEAFGHDLVGYQKGIMWWLGDCARAAAVQSPDNWSQCFPEGPPDMLSRCMAVARAYPHEADRNPLASWTIHMQNANRPDRIQRVEAHVEAGRTSDEARKADQAERSDRPRWLLAVDVNYYLHRFWFSGAGVEAAKGVATWIQRTVERLKEKGLTDVACCLDSTTNHRKKLTDDWDDKYKDRPPKDVELVQQLQLVRGLLEGHGFVCVSVDGMEADDCMASYGAQFVGRVTLLTQDKDLRQCLSDHCNMLLDVEWTEDETTGDMMPDYKWLSAKQHYEATGIRPDEWADFQTITGDSVDGVKGVPGIGPKGALDLGYYFGDVDAVIKAAKDDDERIKPKKREALIEFESKADVTRKLVTLKTDLELPSNTRI